ncbi:hypothetical protein TCA2_4482 [Paenibacillus sp. TCA20]|uniref:Uncharacterized protein n=1 Tax=Paenibacillus urinalis TaxID=521520 RepID=A0ABY7XHD6_9BACL|nr:MULTISPECIES: hypothetical protein [Paenibacillus]WDI05183.1 hypothetical protein PUW25_25580 [Paenibacillus urinalis]GAK41990.1 hypothetical protein TCA2_4482 [Paenibacillus sp. TCA20]
MQPPILHPVNKVLMIPGRLYNIKDTKERNIQASFSKREGENFHFDYAISFDLASGTTLLIDLLLHEDEIISCEQYHF